MSEKEFGLVPSWSKERKVKYSTHNARLVSTDEKSGKPVPIYMKPTWREAFAGRHCLVPMDLFIEPIYTGEFAGNMVKFIPKGEEVILDKRIKTQGYGRQFIKAIPSCREVKDLKELGDFFQRSAPNP